MRPLTDDRPKPLVEVGGRALVDRAIDRLAEAGVEEVVVNLHYMADMLERHLAQRQEPRIIFSDERDVLLDTGGGVARALPFFGDEPFFVVNSDALWIDPPKGARNLEDMSATFEACGYEYLMMVTKREGSVGYTGLGDFDMDDHNRLSWRKEDSEAEFMFTGVQIMHRSLFERVPDGAFSNKWIWDEVLIPTGRFKGFEMQGRWLHASSAQDVEDIERVMKDQP